MKTSFSDIFYIEKFIKNELDAGQSVVFQARLLIDKELRCDTFFQRMVYRLIQLYHRKKIKAEIVNVHEKLFNDQTKSIFRENITKLFNDSL